MRCSDEGLSLNSLTQSAIIQHLYLSHKYASKLCKISELLILILASIILIK